MRMSGVGLAGLHPAGLSAGLLLALAGCAADPADETPVRLAPGNYFVTSSQSVAGTTIPDPMISIDENVCVFPDEAADFPRAFTDFYLGSAAGCSVDDWEREGNAFHGIASCPTEKETMIAFRKEFDGVVAAGRVDVVGRVKVRLSDDLPAPTDPSEVEDRKRAVAATNRNRLELRYTAVRTGDCGKLSMPFGTGK